MKEKVFEAIKSAGANGICLRYIGYYCKCWRIDCLKYVYELINEGKVYNKTIGHGIEAYIKYYVKEQ